MNYKTRRTLYRQIERDRGTKVLTFVTSDRAGMGTIIAPDCIDLFVDLLDKIGPTRKISLILHTNGGSTLAAWRLVNLIRTFCDDLELLIPLKALSAGTLIAIGADRLVMTKQAALGPIDPSVNNPLNPQVNMGNQMARVPVSVENVRGYLDAARNDLGIKSEAAMMTVLTGLSQQIHPLVLGEIFRSRAQIRFLAGKLIKRQVSQPSKVKSIIDFLCADSGSHDYTINRREAAELGLKVQKPSDSFYRTLRKIHLSYAEVETAAAVFATGGAWGAARRSLYRGAWASGKHSRRMLRFRLRRYFDQNASSDAIGTARRYYGSKNVRGLEEADMTIFRQTADATGEYRVRTGANIARLESSSQCGNLADATKNSTVIVPTVTILPREQLPMTADKTPSPVRRP